MSNGFFLLFKVSWAAQGSETEEASLWPLLAAPRWISCHFNILHTPGGKEGTGSRAVKKKACWSNLQLPLPPRMTLVRTAHMLGLGISYFNPTLQIIEQSRLQTYFPSDSKPETWHSDSILISSRDSAEFTLEMLLEDATLEKSNIPGPFCIQVVKSHNHGGQVMAGKVSALCLSSWNMQPVGSSTSSTAQIRPLCSL